MTRCSFVPVLVLLLAAVACSSRKPAGGGDPNAPQRDAVSTADAPPAAPAEPTTITIENRRATPIWVPSQTSCAQLPYAVTAPDGAPVRLDGQVLGCETARTGNCPVFGSCQGPGVWRIEPGKTITASWTGLVMVTRTLSPAEAKPGCPTTCADWLPAPAGTYVLTAAAWSTCTGADCACSTDGTPCAHPAALSGDPDLATDAALVIRGDAPPSGVLMVFAP